MHLAKAVLSRVPHKCASGSQDAPCTQAWHRVLAGMAAGQPEQRTAHLCFRVGWRGDRARELECERAHDENESHERILLLPSSSVSDACGASHTPSTPPPHGAVPPQDAGALWGGRGGTTMKLFFLTDCA